MPPLTSTEYDANCKMGHLNQHNIKNTIEPTAEHKTKDDLNENPLKINQIFSLFRAWEKKMGFETELKWKNLIALTLFHVITVVWLTYNMILGHWPKWQTLLYAFFMGQVAGFGVTAGAHRYWSHRSYKAKLPLQWFLLIFFSVAGQKSVYDWVRDHRLHHKFSETSADPHSANRGFFFAHMGWLMMKKHPDAIRNGRKIDMSDILNDPLCQFHAKYFYLHVIAFCFVLPTLVPQLWGESWDQAILSQVFVRYIISLHFAWTVNSFAHLWGNKPYDPNIMPAENWGVSVLAMGEGWHNYHHTFPWDYKASEVPYTLNVTTWILNGFAALGLAYDMKQASPSLVQAISNKRNQKT